MTKAATPMLLVCPGCGVFGAIETFANDPDARVVAGQFGELQPDVAVAIQRYLRLHAPAKHALTWRKARKVLDELVPLIKSGEIRRSGRAWSAPGAAWISAIESMLDSKNLHLPLKSNGYLLEILASQADKAEADVERKNEEKRIASRPAATRMHDDERQTAHRAQVGTATSMLANRAKELRTRNNQTLSERDARELLANFTPDIITDAIATWQRLEGIQ